MPIVIVDDSPTALVVLKSFAAARGERDVVTFTQPLEALEFLGQNDAEAIVVDCSMPRMDGIQLTQRLREGDRHKETPIIMVTATEGPEVRARAEAAGISAFLEKPVKMTQFKAVLGRLLGNGGWPFIDRRENRDGSPPDGVERRGISTDPVQVPFGRLRSDG